MVGVLLHLRLPDQLGLLHQFPELAEAAAEAAVAGLWAILTTQGLLVALGVLEHQELFLFIKLCRRIS